MAAVSRDGSRRSSGTIEVPAPCGFVFAAGPQPCGEGRGCGSGALRPTGSESKSRAQAGQEEPSAERRQGCGPQLGGSPGTGAAAAVGLRSQV